MLTQNILTQPTFDLIDWSILSYNPNDQILFCQSNQVFKFDKCKGTIKPHSRILRKECEESESVKNVISATIDAGFVGKLVFKIELTHEGKYVLPEKLRLEIQNSVQIDLNPFPNNYYSGTNQTELEPDVFFTSGNSPIEINNEDFMKGFYLGNSEKESFEGEVKEDSVRLKDIGWENFSEKYLDTNDIFAKCHNSLCKSFQEGKMGIEHFTTINKNWRIIETKCMEIYPEMLKDLYNNKDKTRPSFSEKMWDSLRVLTIQKQIDNFLSDKERFEVEMKLDNPEAEIKLLGREVEIAVASVGFGPKNKTIFNEIKTFEVDYPRV